MTRKREGLRVGIVNPLTLVGKEIQSILRERGVAYSHITLIDTTGDEAGTLTEVDAEAAVVSKASKEEFEGLDVVFFCGSPAANAQWIERHREAGFIAVDVAQPSSMGGEGLAVVAGVNLDSVDDQTRLIISPHPIAVTVTLLLNQIATVAPIRLATVSVIQPASDFDQKGIDELLQQVVKVLNVESFPKEIFDRQLAFNLFPALRAAESEQYVVEQVRSILGDDLQLSIAVTQGGMFHSHSFAIFVQTREEVAEDELLDALRESDAILVAEPDESFGTIDAGGKDQVLIGRISRDPRIENAFWIWAVVDNLRRSSALNAVLAAEQVMSRLMADA